MHWPICTFWANLTPLAQAGGLLASGAGAEAAMMAEAERMAVAMAPDEITLGGLG